MPHVARDIPLRMSSGREKTAPSATVKGERAVPAIVEVGVVRNSGDANIARRRRRPCSRSGRRRGRTIGGRSGGGGMVLSWRAGGRETGGAALGAAGVGSVCTDGSTDWGCGGSDGVLCGGEDGDRGCCAG